MENVIALCCGVLRPYEDGLVPYRIVRDAALSLFPGLYIMIVLSKLKMQPCVGWTLCHGK